MLEKNAFDFVQQYIAGWKSNKIQFITASLAEHGMVFAAPIRELYLRLLRPFAT